MKRIVFLLSVILISNWALAQNNLLWEVSHPDKEKTSYIYGTLHLMKSGYLDSLPRVKSAYENAEVVVVETVIDSSKLPQVGQMSMLQNKSLKDLLTEEEYAKVSDFMQERVSYPMQVLQRFKPMQLVLMATMNLYAEVETPMQQAQGMPIDQYFAYSGKKRGKEVVALEAMMEQMQMLYGETSDSAQADLLLDFVEMEEEMRKITAELIEAYENKSLEKLHAMYEQNSEMFQSMSFLLDDRNENWMPRITEICEQGNAFIAVGAMHLAGKNGLIHLLRSRGYTVKPAS